MDKVSEYLISMITKQVENSGLVVWYDPEKNYTNVINELTIPETTILRFENSFFKLRSEIEPLLEFINKDNKPRHDCGVPPRLLIYVPKSRNETHYALIEAEAAGVVLEPGAHPWVRNTRLRVIAEQVFKKLAPNSVSDICRQVDEGRLSLEELDRLSLEVECLATVPTIGTHPILLPGNVIPRETHCYERKSSFLIVRRICRFAGAPCTSRKAS